MACTKNCNPEFDEHSEACIKGFQSMAEKEMRDLPWPEIGKSVTLTSPKNFIAWDALLGNLNGPDEKFPATEVQLGDEITLRVWLDCGTISKDGRMIGRY